MNWIWWIWASYNNITHNSHLNSPEGGSKKAQNIINKVVQETEKITDLTKDDQEQKSLLKKDYFDISTDESSAVTATYNPWLVMQNSQNAIDKNSQSKAKTELEAITDKVMWKVDKSMDANTISGMMEWTPKQMANWTDNSEQWISKRIYENYALEQYKKNSENKDIASYQEKWKEIKAKEDEQTKLVEEKNVKTELQTWEKQWKDPVSVNEKYNEEVKEQMYA